MKLNIKKTKYLLELLPKETAFHQRKRMRLHPQVGEEPKPNSQCHSHSPAVNNTTIKLKIPISWIKKKKLKNLRNQELADWPSIETNERMRSSTVGRRNHGRRQFHRRGQPRGAGCSIERHSPASPLLSPPHHPPHPTPRPKFAQMLFHWHDAASF